MAAFTEKSGVEEWNNQPSGTGALQLHFRGSTHSQASFPNLQFSGNQICDSLTERDRPTNQCNVCSARTVIDNFFKLEVDTGKQQVD